MYQWHLFREAVDHDVLPGMSSRSQSASTAVLRSVVQCSPIGVIADDWRLELEQERWRKSRW